MIVIARPTPRLNEDETNPHAAQNKWLLSSWAPSASGLMVELIVVIAHACGAGKNAKIGVKDRNAFGGACLGLPPSVVCMTTTVDT